MISGFLQLESTIDGSTRRLEQNSGLEYSLPKLDLSCRL
jgi:hypothetical protein